MMVMIGIENKSGMDKSADIHCQIRLTLALSLVLSCGMADDCIKGSVLTMGVTNNKPTALPSILGISVEPWGVQQCWTADCVNMGTPSREIEKGHQSADLSQYTKLWCIRFTNSHNC